MSEIMEPLIGQVKSRLLPLSPMMGALERLIECLPRRLIRVVLKPGNDVAITNESKGEYQATGNTPKFDMALMPALPQGGWYYLEAALVRHNGNREANISGNAHGDTNKCFTIPISTNLRGTIREVFYLPANVTELRWSPTAAPGYFSQSPFLLHKISLLERTVRQMCRVIFDLWRFRIKASFLHEALSCIRAVCDLQISYQRSAIFRIKRQLSNDYSAFVALKDTFKSADIRALKKQVPRLSLHPVVSIIITVQAPNELFLRAAIDSVIGQIYPHWELLLVGDFTEDTPSYTIVDQYRKKHNQIKIISANSNVGIASTLNSALALAEGTFVTRINQHDLIASHALFFLVQEICKHPDADLIYSDEDNIDDANKRHHPRFKPDWNPDLFFSHNYFGNLTLYRLAHVLALGGYSSGYEGAEEYELSLRYLRDISKAYIRHIAMVLCHKRIANHTLALSSSHLSNECIAHQSGKRALTAYFKSDGTIVEDGPALGFYRLRHPLPEHRPLVSIIIPTRDQLAILKKCIASIQQKTDYVNWELLIVDNQSIEVETHRYFAHIQNDSRIKVIDYDKPFNYSALNNFASQYAQGEIFALLNNDVEVIDKEWLSEMVSHAIRPGVGAVGAKLLYANGTVQHAGVILGLGGVAGHAHKHLKSDDFGYCHRAVVAQNFSAVTGACLVVRKECYQAVGGLNEPDLAVALNDIDFCLKLLAAGYRNVFTPFAQLYHHESISRGANDTPEKNAIFSREFEYMKRTWGQRLLQDPAYNPNLTMSYENFSYGS
jgi:glycosyltransferase involved in cell wall biosynthesis